MYKNSIFIIPVCPLIKLRLFLKAKKYSETKSSSSRATAVCDQRKERNQSRKASVLMKILLACLFGGRLRAATLSINSIHS